MCRVVLPFVSALIDTVTALNVVNAVTPANIRVAVEIVIHVYVDVVATPTGSPAPAAAPCSTHRNANTERDRARGDYGTRRVSRVIDRRIWINRRAIDNRRVIGRHVNDLWVSLLNHDDSFVFYDLGFDFLLLVRSQSPGSFCLRPHSLNGVHHIALLSQKSITQIGSPLDVIGQTLYNIGQRSHRFYARIPWLFSNCIRQCFVFEARVLGQPLLKLNEFQRIG
jgi:hypothetical protein